MPFHRSIARTVRGLRISPLPVVEHRTAVRVIMDLTVRHGVNTDTSFDRAPVHDLGGRSITFIAQTCARHKPDGTEVPTYFELKGSEGRF